MDGNGRHEWAALMDGINKCHYWTPIMDGILMDVISSLTNIRVPAGTKNSHPIGFLR
jgi:hypothetical protein